jgi:hypothetical protein
VRCASGDVFRGRYRHGARVGRGVTEFDGGDSLEGRYADDVLEGDSVYTYADGDSVACRYEGGMMEGPYEERAPDGWVSCVGTMEAGERKPGSKVEFRYPDGGVLSGCADDEGEVGGEAGGGEQDGWAYHYPIAGETGGARLQGRWADGATPPSPPRPCTLAQGLDVSSLYIWSCPEGQARGLSGARRQDGFGGVYRRPDAQESSAGQARQQEAQGD